MQHTLEILLPKSNLVVLITVLEEVGVVDGIWEAFQSCNIMDSITRLLIKLLFLHTEKPHNIVPLDGSFKILSTTKYHSCTEKPPKAIATSYRGSSQPRYREYFRGSSVDSTGMDHDEEHINCGWVFRKVARAIPSWSSEPYQGA